MLSASLQNYGINVYLATWTPADLSLSVYFVAVTLLSVHLTFQALHITTTKTIFSTQYCSKDYPSLWGVICWLDSFNRSTCCLLRGSECLCWMSFYNLRITSAWFTIQSLSFVKRRKIGLAIDRPDAYMYYGKSRLHGTVETEWGRS